MIRKATELDIQRIKYIWDRSFDDSLNYVDFLLDHHVVTPDRILVYEEENTVYSICMMIDTLFSYKEEQIPVVYLYGCATLAEAEHRGYMTKLIARAEQIAESEGKRMSFLVPGSRMLFGFYKKMGYNADLPKRILVLRAGMLDGTESSDVPLVYDMMTAEEMYAIRESYLYETPHIEWKPDQLDYHLADGIAYGEHIVSYVGKEGKAYIFYGIERRKMYIREIMGTTEKASMVLLAQLINDQNPKKVEIELPAVGGLFTYEGNVEKYGMSKTFGSAKPLSSLHPYMNLMLE